MQIEERNNGEEAKFTRAQINAHIRNIQKAMEKQKREAEERGDMFKSLSPEEIEKKLNRTTSPFLAGGAYTGGASPGGIISYLINIYNPDPTPADELFMHVWVGSGNADPTVGTFLLNVDTRFPRLLLPTASGGGLRIAPNTITWLQFDLAVPTNVETKEKPPVLSLSSARRPEGNHATRHGPSA
jgi:hypothetical protein